MPSFSSLGQYLLGVAISIIGNSLYLSYKAGKKIGTDNSKVQEHDKWIEKHEPKIDKLVEDVSRINGRLNGGTYKHQ
jgi:hypothetical protein